MPYDNPKPILTFSFDKLGRLVGTRAGIGNEGALRMIGPGLGYRAQADDTEPKSDPHGYDNTRVGTSCMLH